MPGDDHGQESSRSIVVLILIASMILAAGWHSQKTNTRPSFYFWTDGKLIRSQDSEAGKDTRLAARMACAATPPEAARFFGLPLPINRADQYALVALPGIGQKLAENILNYRAGQGGIAGPDDLIKVKGIGPKRLARLTPLLCFDQAQ
jgi:predicted flap endonuclease-1-like 5' DNA nuclease